MNEILAHTSHDHLGWPDAIAAIAILAAITIVLVAIIWKSL